jgi:hypothetical protein
MTTEVATELNETAEPVVDAPTPTEPAPTAQPVAGGSKDDGDDALSYFAKLAQQD